MANGGEDTGYSGAKLRYFTGTKLVSTSVKMHVVISTATSEKITAVAGRYAESIC